MTQLFEMSDFSPMYERENVYIFELVSQTAKTAILRCIASTLYGNTNHGEFRVRIADRDELGNISRLRGPGGQRYGQSYHAISMIEATKIMRGAA